MSAWLEDVEPSAAERAERDAAEAEILDALHRRLGGRADPGLVGYLIQKGFVGNAAADLAGFGLAKVVEDLLAEYKDLASLGSRHREPVVREAGDSGDPDLRGRALARIFAIDASHDEVLVAYRERWLGGHTIEREAVRSWVRMRRSIRMDDRRGHRPTSVETITYLALGSAHPEVVVAPVTGPLAELKVVAARLSMRCGWTEAEAVTFTLTGVTPWLPAIRASVRHRAPWTAASKIELEISPRAKPAEVAAMYRKARVTAIGSERRRRDLQSPERAELAVFAFERADGRSWRTIMVEWNEQAPATYRRYADVRSFARDARAAFRAITGTELS